VEKCPRCGEQVAERAKFCPECGAALAAPPPAREERKIVTVVFCDLVGSTAQAERLDPEDVRAILSTYHEQVRAEIEELVSLLEETETEEGLMAVALVAGDLGLRERIRPLIARSPVNPWTEAIAAVAEGRFEEAAERLNAVGEVPREAELRLRAAAELAAAGRRAEADEQLRKALAFFRSVGATRYIRKGEALFAKSA
jgi:class 3 adenylate cyclase